MLNNSQKVAALVKARKILKTSEVALSLGVSRQYASQLLNLLVQQGRVVKIGTTRNARYTLPELANKLVVRRVKLRLENAGIKEHEVLENFVALFPAFRRAPENVQSIIRYGFSEMLNNAIEHSKSKSVIVEMSEDEKSIGFVVNDLGVGVFRNVMKKRQLKSEFEAMQDLLKGKVTTDPRAHSGEGIFFTSKSADRFILDSFGRRMVVDNGINDVFFQAHKPSKHGTRVTFTIDRRSKRHLNDVFRKFQSSPTEQAFDRTEIHVRLFTMGTIYVSRSQARRILTGLEKFRSIILDFDRVPSVGQAFADEIFRVFKIKNPKVSMTPVHMNEAVRFMIERVEQE